MSLRVGSLVFATSQGLGYLAKSFFDHGVITDAVVIRHGRRPENEDWFPGQPRCPDLQRGKTFLQDFCCQMDVMLFFETPFVWELIPFCREYGVKTAIMPMHECMPKRIPYQPDLWLCPSALDMQWVSPRIHARMAGNDIVCPESKFLPVPVEVPWRQRTKAEIFVHNAGWGGLKGRNGTAELMEALHYVKSSARFIIRSQEKLEDRYGKHACPGVEGSRLDYRVGTFPSSQLWEEGDVFIFPERFNGLSLPLQEARAAGMLVMATDRFPMNTWLPSNVHDSFSSGIHQVDNDKCPLNDPETFINQVVSGLPCSCPSPLIPVADFRRSCVAARCADFDEAILDPLAIAQKIDEWYGKDLTEYSLQGREWAKSMSWEALKPRYMEVLESLL